MQGPEKARPNPLPDAMSTDHLPSPPARRMRGAARLMGRLLAPGERLMRSLRMRTKLTLVASAALVPLCLVMAMALGRLWDERQVNLSELEGAQVADRIVGLAGTVQRHRSLMHRAQLGDVNASGDLEAAHRTLAAEVATLDQALQGLTHFSLLEPWAPLKKQLLALSSGTSDNPAAAFDNHVRAVQDLHEMIQSTAERTLLDLDPVADTYYLASVTTHSLLPLQEATAQARALGTGVLMRVGDSTRNRAAVLVTVGQVERSAAEVKNKLGALQRAGGELPGSVAQALEQVDRFAAETLSLFASELPQGEARAHYETGSAALASLAALHRDASQRLMTALENRLKANRNELLIMLGTFSAGIALLLYLLASFLTSFERTLRMLIKGTQAISSGNLAMNMEVQGRDELADMARVVEGMSMRLSSLVSEIRNSASLVNHTGQQVSDGSARLASRTDEQASSLRVSVDAINDLAAAVARNADAACDLNGLTSRLTQEAEDGHAAMQDTVQAMDQMRGASERVAQVVAVIDDVAFQTSMLSLNAAIEASRAGEAGKGFAIVATEVRQLAQRCAESAEQIRSHIGEAGTQVNLSTEKLARASQSLDALVAGVREVSTALQQISDSSAQQSQELQQVTLSVGNLDEITRENAALVEESSTASHALVSRAGTLREAVASMRLRQGSADEALAMVERARDHVAQAGRDQAFSDFHDAQAGFIDRDLYIFAFDREGVYSVCGAKPANVGQSYNVTPGLDSEFVERIWAAADAGGGWVRYEVVNPLNDAVTPKESYVLALDAHTLIGCGIYRDATGEAPRRANAWSRKQEAALA